MQLPLMAERARAAEHGARHSEDAEDTIFRFGCSSVPIPDGATAGRAVSIRLFATTKQFADTICG
jgi:hypothetical protein